MFGPCHPFTLERIPPASQPATHIDPQYRRSVHITRLTQFVVAATNENEVGGAVLLYAFGFWVELGRNSSLKLAAGATGRHPNSPDCERIVFTHGCTLSHPHVMGD